MGVPIGRWCAGGTRTGGQDQSDNCQVASVGIGASILLIAVGAVLAFAIDFDISGVDISVIGWILMAAGALGLVATLVIWAPRRRPPPSGPPEQRIPDGR